MTDIKPLVDLCDWKLLKGSHDWPGPHGGTCINEAAIVAAGFAYKSIEQAKDCPPCFSPIISAYLIRLNDDMPNNQRQSLMRFVTRLSGSADSPDVERQRLKYIIIATVQRLVSRALDRAGLPSQAEDCRTATTLTAAGRAAVRAKDAAYADSIVARDSTRWAVAGDAADVADAAATAARAARRSAADWDRAAVAAASIVRLVAATSGDDAAEAATPAEIFSEAIAILDGALAIGNRATDIDAALVLERMNKIRRAFVFVERTA